MGSPAADWIPTLKLITSSRQKDTGLFNILGVSILAVLSGALACGFNPGAVERAWLITIALVIGGRDDGS